MSEPVFTPALAHIEGGKAGDGLTIGLSEVTDRGMIDLRGNAASQPFTRAVKQVLGVGLPTRPRTSAREKDVEVLWLSVDQWLIICPRDDAPKLAAKLARAVEKQFALVVDVSDARTIIRLEGENAREVLMKGTSVDLTLPEFKAGVVRRMMFAEIAAMAHIVTDDPLVIDLYVFRSYGAYAWDWLTATAGEGAKVSLFGR